MATRRLRNALKFGETEEIEESAAAGGGGGAGGAAGGEPAPASPPEVVVPKNLVEEGELTRNWFNANAKEPGNLLLGSYYYDFKTQGKYLPPTYNRSGPRAFEAEIMRNPRLQKKRNAVRNYVKGLVRNRMRPGFSQNQRDAVWYDAIGTARQRYGADPEIVNILQTGHEVLHPGLPENTGRGRNPETDYILKYYTSNELKPMFNFRNQNLNRYVKKGGTRKRRNLRRKTRRRN